jgi:hypothetical protein
MIPAGYLAKRVCIKPDWLRAKQVTHIYSVSGCSAEIFAYRVDYEYLNGFWLFDSPEIIQIIAQENSIDLAGTTLFYYEIHEEEFDGGTWHPCQFDSSFKTSVVLPVDKHLEGFDVVTYSWRKLPEHSPLSCNSLAEEVPTNSNCLFQSFEDAERNVTNGTFKDSEPGPYRIFSVYSVDWGSAKSFHLVSSHYLR